jgi:RNA polymerase sigma-70 factor (ECF subfamily)
VTDPHPTDEELIHRFQEGDKSSYDELVSRFKGPLFSFIYRILGDRAFAEDLLQETFLRLWVNRDSYREVARFSTWIYTVAGNLAKTELRRQKIRRWFPISSGSSAGEDEVTIEISDPDADPHRDLERATILRRVDEEIRRLPLVFREVIILRDVRELSYDEISKILRIPIGTVKSRVNRGRLRLQKRLQDLL